MPAAPLHTAAVQVPVHTPPCVLCMLVLHVSVRMVSPLAHRFAARTLAGPSLIKLPAGMPLHCAVLTV